ASDVEPSRASADRRQREIAVEDAFPWRMEADDESAGASGWDVDRRYVVLLNGEDRIAARARVDRKGRRACRRVAHVANDDLATRCIAGPQGAEVQLRRLELKLVSQARAGDAADHVRAAGTPYRHLRLERTGMPGREGHGRLVRLMGLQIERRVAEGDL